MSDPIAVVSHVSKRYAAHTAVSDVSLRVPKGVIYGLLGPNGAGKTTTIRMLNDIVKPDEGSIVLFGDLAPGRAALRRIGYLPEERGLYQKMTVRRVLTFLAELRGLSKGVIEPRIAKWLDRLALTEWADRKVENLSKGMQQKVQFVAAVLHEPDLVILDEPFSGLDPINADVLREIVKEQRASGRTILFSTHLMEHAEQMCDDIAILARSRKVLDGKLEEIKAQAQKARRGVVVELEGDVGNAEGSIPTALKPESLPGVLRTVKLTRGFELTLAPDAEHHALLRSILDAGLRIVRFEIAAPTLHEIFVERVTEHAAATHENPSRESAEEGHPRG